MDRSGCAISQALVWTVIVVEVEIALQPVLQRQHGRILCQINGFIFDAAPEALIENVIKGAASSIHTDLNACGDERISKEMSRELSALVGVEDFRFSAKQGLL